MKFSERMGFVSLRTAIQCDTMDEALRTSLWNVFWTLYCGERLNSGFNFIYNLLYQQEGKKLLADIWTECLRFPVDKMQSDAKGVLNQLSEVFMFSDCPLVYDLIEFVAQNCPKDYKDGFTSGCNRVLERDMSAFRFVGDQLCLITSKTEIAEIEEAMNSPVSTVNSHLSKALEHLSDRENPDYRNSIKESISAVEALLKAVTKMETETFGRAFEKIQQTFQLHSDLYEGFKKLYWYTCGPDGIRHAMMESSNGVESEDAKFFLVSCSAFVNYLIAKADKAGITL